jgi:hypothetical protein
MSISTKIEASDRQTVNGATVNEGSGAVKPAGDDNPLSAVFIH